MALVDTLNQALTEAKVLQDSVEGASPISAHLDAQKVELVNVAKSLSAKLIEIENREKVLTERETKMTERETVVAKTKEELKAVQAELVKKGK